MDFSKDYYAILGVIPTAEDVVIRAAYKALAQRYHPDKREDCSDDTTAIMADINEAYKILSSHESRAEYDRARGDSTQSSEEYFKDSAAPPPKYDPLAHDWLIAVKFFPSLISLDESLSKISWRLAYSYRALMLELKEFDRGRQIAEEMQNRFLSVYFGSDLNIVLFAEKLIFSGQRKAARALSAAIKVLGKSANASQVIKQICDDFYIRDEDDAQRATQEEIKNTLQGGLIVCSVNSSTSDTKDAIRAGDVIVAYNNRDVRHKRREFELLLKETEGKSDIPVQIYRENQAMHLWTDGGDIGLSVAQLV